MEMYLNTRTGDLVRKLDKSGVICDIDVKEAVCVYFDVDLKLSTIFAIDKKRFEDTYIPISKITSKDPTDELVKESSWDEMISDLEKAKAIKFCGYWESADLYYEDEFFEDCYYEDENRQYMGEDGEILLKVLNEDWFIKDPIQRIYPGKVYVVNSEKYPGMRFYLIRTPHFYQVLFLKFETEQQ